MLSGPKIRRFNGHWHLWYIAGRKWKIVDGQGGAGLQDPHGDLRRRHPLDKLNRDLIPSRIEEDEAQASPDVFYANGKYHMFFCYRYSSDYRGKENGYRIGYASQHRPDRLGARRRQGGHRRVGAGLGRRDDQLSARVRTRRQDIHGLSRQPGRSVRLRPGRADGQVPWSSATMKWRKLGKIFDPTQHGLPNGCVQFAQSPQALVFDDFVRIYFSTRAVDRATANISATSRSSI